MFKQSLRKGRLSPVAHPYLDTPLYVYYIFIYVRIIAASRNNNIIVISLLLSILIVFYFIAIIGIYCIIKFYTMITIK